MQVTAAAEAEELPVPLASAAMGEIATRHKTALGAAGEMAVDLMRLKQQHLLARRVVMGGATTAAARRQVLEESRQPVQQGAAVEVVARAQAVQEVAAAQDPNGMTLMARAEEPAESAIPAELLAAVFTAAGAAAGPVLADEHKA